MKKIYLFTVIIVMLFIGLNLHAKDNGFGVRAGVNIASMTNYNAKVGFHVGGMYRLQLLSDYPFFFEPGLMFQLKGGRLSQSGVSSTLNVAYVEIPATFAYRFRLNDTWAIQCAFGPYFAVGVTGTVKQSYMGQTQSADLFGANGALKRGDLGLKIALGTLIKSVYVGIGYDLGFINLPKNYSQGNPKLKNGSFYVSAGYNF